MGNQRVGIFPPKSKILFVLSLALIWCRNFQDRTIPLGGDTWPCFWRKEGIIRTRYTSARQYVMPCESGRRSRDHRPTVKQRFLDVSSNLGKFWKKSLNGHATVVGGHATAGRLSNNVFWTFQAISENFEKSRWTVTRQWLRSRDRRPTVKQRFFGRFKQLEIFLKKVAERSRDSGRRSRDRRPTVKQRFLDVSSDLGKFWKKSRNGHATMVEVTRLSADCQTTFFGRFKQLEIFFEKSRWTVTRQWSEVTRPSADCQTTFFGRFKRFGKILKKVAERSRDSGWGHATVRRLSNNVFWTFQAIRKFFEKSRWTVTPTVVGGHATVGRLSNNVFWTFQAIIKVFEKSRWTVTRQWSEVTRPSGDCQTTFLDVSSDLGKFWKKSLNGHATVIEVTRLSADCQTTFFGRSKRFGKILKKVAERSPDNGWSHATVGRLSNNVFWTFQAIRNFFEKSRWTVTRQWSEVTRPSADCQTTFFGRFKRFGKILKKVAERSRDGGWGHATVRRLSNNVFWTFQAIWENFEKSRWTVTRQWMRSRDCRPTVKQRFLDVSSN